MRGFPRDRSAVEDKMVDIREFISGRRGKIEETAFFNRDSFDGDVSSVRAKRAFGGEFQNAVRSNVERGTVFEPVLIFQDKPSVCDGNGSREIMRGIERNRRSVCDFDRFRTRERGVFAEFEVMSVETTAAFTETAPAKPARQKSELRMPFFPSF